MRLGSPDTTYAYRLERADWLAYESRPVPLAGRRFAVTLLFPMAAGALYGIGRESGLAWLPFASDGWADKLALAAVVFLAWFLGMTAFLTISAHRRASRHTLFPTDTTLHVSPDRLTETTGEQARVLTWDMVGDVEVASRHVFVYPAGAQSIVVPERAFEVMPTWLHSVFGLRRAAPTPTRAGPTRPRLSK